VLYDMLAGTRPFGGNTVTDTLAAILEREPDWDALPATTQPSLLKLLRRCLHKDMSSRLHDVADARIEIEDLLAGSGEALGRVESDQGPAHPSSRASQRTAWAVAAVAVVVAAWVLWSSQLGAPAGRTAPNPSISRTIIQTEPLLTDGRVPALAISPDGRRVAYSASGATGQIYVRDIDSLEALSLDGTEGAFGPFFSPDGERIGFAADGWLSTVSTRGGPANPLQQIRVFLGGDWSEDSGIVYGEWPTRHLWRIDATGGAATALTDPMADIRYYIDVAPSFVSGGEAVVFNNFNAFTSPGEPVVRAQGVDSEKQRVLDLVGSHVHYVPTGHLVFAKGGSLFAAPFDADELELVGSPVGVLAGVLTSVYGAAHYDVSNTGTLIYLPGAVQRPEHRLVWVDRSGNSSPITDESRGFWGPRLSPDGTRVAVWIADERPHIWIYDLLRGGLTPLTTEASNFWSIWTPDGTAIAFASRQEDGTGYIARQVANRSSPAEAIVGEEISIVEQPLSWAESGEVLIFQRGSEREGGFDLWSAFLADASEHRALVSTKANEYHGVVSPDGRWLAYVSDESGRPEIYVRPYPAVDRTIPISTQGGEEPLWAPSGRELFYRSEGRMMVVDIETGQSFSPSRPRVLFEDRFIHGTPYGRNYDIDRSGQRFLMSESATDAQQATQIVVVQNWFEELKRLVPVEQRQE
jgi:serine/threonine-protein kinase